MIPLKIAGSWMFFGGVLLCVLGVLLWSMDIMAWGMLATTVGYSARDYFDPNPKSITPATVFAVMGTWASLSHFIAEYFLDTQYEKFFYSSYPAMSYLPEAQVLMVISILVPLLTYPWFTRLLDGPRPLFAVPKIGFNTSDRATLNLCLIFLAFGWLGNLGLAFFESIGTVGYFFANGSDIAVFLLAWHWYGPRPTFPSWSRLLLFVAPVVDSLNALMFSTRRGEIVYPFFALLTAMLLRKAFKLHHLLLLLAILPIFSFVYYKIGLMRSGANAVSGAERVTNLKDDFFSEQSENTQFKTKEVEGSETLAGIYSLMARGCQFGPLSQVARIADEEGFYYGQTLSYLTYAFIPRFIWPDKPLITPGQWFAEKLGRGTRISETQFSNAINMTLPGEFYLNFGWTAAILGTALMALLYAVIWSSIGFYDEGNNPIGALLGLAVFLQAAAVSSAAALIYLISTYLLMFGVRQLLGILERRRKQTKQVTYSQTAILPLT